MSELRITSGKGLHFTFENGVTISVQIGAGNSCDNYNLPFSAERDNLPASKTAEIAVWNAAGKWLTFEGDEVVGYLPVDRVVEAIAYVKAMRGDEETAEFPWGATEDSV